MAEAERLTARQHYRIADTEHEETFDRFARMAQRLFDAPIGLVTLVDGTHQAFKACYGLDHRGSERVDSFCTHAIEQDDTLVVLDARRDERVRDNPQVAEPPHLRVYAGAPMRCRDGHVWGTLCVLDTKPRARPTPELVRQLEELADATMDAIERRLHGMELAAARARERREAARMRARGHVLERISRHDPLPEILADVAGPLGAVARRILAALSRPHQVFDRTVPLAPSIGVARWPKDGRDPDTLLAAADVAMYEAKQAGKATVRSRPVGKTPPYAATSWSSTRSNHASARAQAASFEARARALEKMP